MPLNKENNHFTTISTTLILLINYGNKSKIPKNYY
jgi:hypothetical protein